MSYQISVIVTVLLGVFLPSLVLSQLVCHRCYGNSHCNNGTHEDFINDTRTATCNVQVNFTDLLINDPILYHLQKAINGMRLDDSGGDVHATTTGHCVTATIHEPRESHTLRTCLTRTAANPTNTLCKLIKEIISPMNWYGGDFSCRACNNSHQCNSHTLAIGDGLEEPQPAPTTEQPTTTSTTTPQPAPTTTSTTTEKPTTAPGSGYMIGPICAILVAGIAVVFTVI